LPHWQEKYGAGDDPSLRRLTFTSTLIRQNANEGILSPGYFKDRQHSQHDMQLGKRVGMDIYQAQYSTMTSGNESIFCSADQVPAVAGVEYGAQQEHYPNPHDEYQKSADQCGVVSEIQGCQ
jgi:hypothetical protein